MDRRLFLHLALAAAATPVWGAAPQVSQRPTQRPGRTAAARVAGGDALIAQANLGGKTGYAVMDLDTGQVLEAASPLVKLPPASVAKAATALYALENLGPTHRFETQLVARGQVSGGRLNGDLVLVGSGDPTLDTDALAQLAAGAKAAGVREITGRLLVWTRALPYIRQIDPDQPDHLGYNPAISGVNLNFNRVYFEWKRAGQGYSTTMDARSDRYRPEVASSRIRIVDRDLPVFTYRDRNSVDDWSVARTALGNGGGRWLPVRHPGLYAGDVLRTMLRANGIVVSAPQTTSNRPNGQIVARVQSEPLARIAQDMLRFSTNITAECLGLAATQTLGARGGTLRGSGGSMEAWLRSRTGVAGARFFDHSGLNDESRISAREMVQILAASGVQGALGPVLKPIPMVDRNGKKLSNPSLAVAAKTGTLNFVSALSGYATTGNGRRLAFAIFSGDVPRRAKIARSNRERPQGARAWNKRARGLQHALLRRWGEVYG